MIELDEVLLNPVCTFNELGQCGSGPEVKELKRDWGWKLAAKFTDGGMGILLTAKIDMELFPLGQKHVSRVVGFHDKTVHGSQRRYVFVRVLVTLGEQEDD